MIKFLNIVICVLSFSFLSCQPIQNIEDRLLKKVAKFGNNPIEGVTYNKLYVMEGTYITHRDFEPIFPKLEIHRGSDPKKYEDYLMIHDNGKVEQFYAENVHSAYQLLNKSSSSSFYGVIYKKNQKIIIETIQAFKMGGGYGTYKKTVKLINKKIYIQEVGKCSVYVLTENN